MGDDTAIGGLKVKTCDIRIGKSLTGEWANVFSSYGMPGLEYEIETSKYEKTSESTTFEEIKKEKYEWAWSAAVEVYFIDHRGKIDLKQESS